MRIQIDRLKGRPQPVQIKEDATAFPILRDLLEEDAVTFETPICGVLETAWVAGLVEVTGRLEAQVASSCGRCLVPVTAPFVATFKLCYSSDLARKDVEEVDELELCEEDLELIPYEGKEIDLRADIEQEIIMALPQQRMCRPDCKGLCPVCGGNLNIKQCDCDAPVFHSGLAALKNLKIKQ